MYKIKYDILLYILVPNIWILIWKIFYPNPTPIGRSNEYPAPGSWPVTFFPQHPGQKGAGPTLPDDISNPIEIP